MTVAFKARHRSCPRRGGRQPAFALVITLSLMVLLSVVAVGLLGLASVTLRNSGQAEAVATAQANARLALLMALGDLQQAAGPDQRITARSDILQENTANPRLTGVWDSWEISATNPPQPEEYERAARDAKFRGWLVSHSDPAAARQVGGLAQALPSPVTLWAKGTLGEQAAPETHVRASKIPVSSQPGALAWAVLDEGIKARVNTPWSNDATSNGLKTAQLGTGERPASELLPGLEPLERRFFDQSSAGFATLGKGFTRPGFALAADTLAPGLEEALKPLAHDLTVSSAGLFTDAARGGLKQDFQLLANSASLPAAYQAKGVYVSRLGMRSTDVLSDPRWESLHQFARLYRDKISNIGGVPLLRTQLPQGWQAATVSGSNPVVTTLNRRPPPGVTLMPVIAKVQVVFSLIGRDLYDYPPPAGNYIPPDAPEFHNPQGSHFRGTKYQYDLHLMYTPVVTLHNPYNVTLEFYNMRVEFVHTPMAVQVFRNGVAQSTGLVPVETMYADNESGSMDKTFGMNLRTKVNNAPGSATFRLLPGEVKMFSPYIPPSRTYRDEFRSGRQTWDIYVGTGITTNIDAIPGWRGDGIGYSCDWLAGAKRVNENKNEGHWASCFGLARDDEIHVEFAPLSVPQFSNNKFIVRVTASTSPTSAPVTTNAIEVDYQSPGGLQDFLLGRGRTLRYPKTGTVKGIDLVDHATTPVSNIRNVKPFALLTLQAKTTSGGRDPSNEDGRLATKPWSFAHAVVGASSQKVLNEHPANHSHEIDLQRLDNGTVNLLQVDRQDRGNFITGHTAFNGVKFGILHEIPVAPLQTLASLNGANPGGSSGYLPRFAQPIGNSWAHPLLGPDKILVPVTGGSYLDHSFLLNLALYDGFYFSGLGDQSGALASGKPTATLAKEFAAGERLDDPRLVLHRPNARPPADLAEEIGKPEGYSRIAAWQMMEGPFNINSTSVLAWKAMLGSIHDPGAIFTQLNKSAGSSRLTDLSATDRQQARISRLRLPASTSAADGAEVADGYWLGPREYSDAELQTLAENIVKQVRLRGPFLSLAEFVNRRLGTGETAQRGALQQAIDDSNLNQSLAAAANAGFEIPAASVANYKYANPAAGTGPSYQGAPGFLTQADLLNVLGNAATPRSDTFTIRGYGEARDPSGRVLATAACEAVVQRVPEWVDPADPVETAPAALTSQANQRFGRRFLVTSFRWLRQNEI